METNKIEEALKLVDNLGVSALDMGKVLTDAVEKSKQDLDTLSKVFDSIWENAKSKGLETMDSMATEGSAPKQTIWDKYKNKNAEDKLGDASSALKSTGEIAGLVDTFSRGTLGSKGGDIAVAVGETLGGLSDATAGVQEMFKGNFFGGLMKAVKGVGTAIASWFKVKDKGLERQIKTLENSSKNLKAEFTKLSKEAEQLFGGSKSNKLEEQIQNLSQQQEILQQQRTAEESKKKKDDSKVAAYNEQIEKSNAELVDLKAKQIDAIMGQDVKTAIGNFAKAYADAWAAGLSPDDSKKKAKQMVQEMVKTAVTELMKDNLSKSVEAFRSRMSDAIKDGIITEAEQSALDELESRIYRDAENFDKNGSLKKYYDAHADETGQSATSKGIAAASQDTVNELNGRFTAIQQHTYEIVGYLRGAADSAEMLRRCVDELGNHGRVLAAMGSEVKYLNRNISNIYSRGIPIRES